MGKKKYYVTISAIYMVFIIALTIFGYFKIGLLSDDYNNLNDAVNTSLIQKFTGKLPFTNSLHLRPIYYLSIQIGYYIHNVLGLSYDNFINFRIGNLFLFLLLSYICGRIVFQLKQNYTLSILSICSILLFPSNIHNICWTAGRVDILCGIFYLSFILFSIKYIQEERGVYFFLSVSSLTCALLTKEYAITAIFICLIFIYFFYGKKVLMNKYKLFITLFIILFIYIVYKFFIDQLVNPNIYGREGLPVYVKAILALFLPIDLLTLGNQLKENNVSILIYFAIFVFFAFVYFLYLIQYKFFKTILFIFILVSFCFVPYAIVGYVRPQMMLIPFATLICFLMPASIFQEEGKKYLFKKISFIAFVIILISWAYISSRFVEQWKFAYTYSRECMENFINSDYNRNVYTIVLGNPGRLGQFFMFDKMTGAYNYWKYKEPVVKDTIYDIVLLGGLNMEAMKSKLKLEIDSANNEYEINASFESPIGNDDQFFYIEGYPIKGTGDVFENDKVKITFYFSRSNKPISMLVKFKTKDVNCYLASEGKYYKIY